jgi:hypothetical protein
MSSDSLLNTEEPLSPVAESIHPIGGPAKAKPSGVLGPRQVWRTAAVTVLLLATVVFLQWLAGALTAEFSGYPDEASHYISGLLVRDYAAAGFPSGPMGFAQDFYMRYPYMAIGHWPPLFYCLEGAWMFLFSPARISVMLLMALITAALAASLYRALRSEFGDLPALISALLLVCSPLVQKYSAMVMLDMLLALLGFWAVLYLARFFETGRWQDSAKFGVIASLAILTKGNGFYLALVPPIALLLTQRFYLVKRAAFWLPALIVAPACAPWHLFTMHLMLPTFEESAGMEFTTRAIRFYSVLAAKSVGLVILALMAIGFFACVVKPLAKRRVATKWGVMAAYLFSILIFYCVVPAGIEARYLIAAMPPIFMFFNAGAAYLARLSTAGMVKPRSMQLQMNFLLLLAIFVFAGTSFAIPRKQSYGFRAAVSYLIAQPDFKNSLSLVSSETSSGEGLFVSEVAMRGARNEHAILRASKLLAVDDWNMTHYTPRYRTAHALMDCLEKTPIGFIVMDMSPGQKQYEHQRQLLEILGSRPDEWKLVGVFDGSTSGRAVRVYRSEKLTGKPVPTRLPMSKIQTNLNGLGVSWPVSMTLACGGPAVE